MAGTRFGGFAAPQHVTLIGDSVAAGIPGDDAALATLRQGVDLQVDVAPCRTLGGTSCPPEPPTALDVVQRLGPELGGTVIVAVGYNEPAGSFAADSGALLSALAAAGVRHVLWTTLHDPTPGGSYTQLNDELRAEAPAHPELTVVDWDAAARGSTGWFQSDGVHLAGPGAEALAALLHAALVTGGVAPSPPELRTSSLPPARRGAAWSAQLIARGGLAPYRWSCRPRLPAGLHLLAGGSLTGVARAGARGERVTFTLTDAAGTMASRTILVAVR